MAGTWAAGAVKEVRDKVQVRVAHRSCLYWAVYGKKMVTQQITVMLFAALCRQIWTGWYWYEMLTQTDRDLRDSKAQVKPGHAFSVYIYRENEQPGIKSNMNTDVQSFTLTWIQNSKTAWQKLAKKLMYSIVSTNMYWSLLYNVCHCRDVCGCLFHG